jgi:hypothetical protein
MIQLKPSKVGVLGTITQIDVLILPFQTDALTCSTYYKLCAEDGKQLAEGNLSLTEEQFANWGTDNSYVSDIVINELGLEKAA